MDITVCLLIVCIETGGPAPIAVEDSCEFVRPYVTEERWKPHRQDGPRSKARYLSQLRYYERNCIDKEETPIK